jgi:hypothetical protein
MRRAGSNVESMGWWWNFQWRSIVVIVVSASDELQSPSSIDPDEEVNDYPERPERYL